MLLPKGLCQSARNYPDKTAVIGEHHRYTYKELEARAAKVKASLIRMGVEKGDRIGILLLNDFRYLELMYAASAIGAVIVPMNTRFTIQENLFVLEDAGVKVFYLNKEFMGILKPMKEELFDVAHIVLAEDDYEPFFQEDDEVLAYEKILAKETASLLTYDEVQEDDLAGLFYTGGTTGRSKGVMLTHKNLLSNAIHVMMNFKNSKADIYLHAAPMFHLADQASTFAVTLAGGTHVTLKQFTPKTFLAVIEREKVTATMLVPTMLNMVIHSADFEKYDISSLKEILYGASPMSTELLKKVMQDIPGILLRQAYGMTEASPILTLLSPEDHHISFGTDEEKRLTSCGKPVQFVEMKIIDEHGDEVSTNEVGEFAAKGPNIMRGYWQLEEETQKVLQNGWYKTGDMGYVDEDGFYYLVDRAKDMIISGGENVYSVEIEQVLYTHPAVLECAVFGAPDEEWGEVVRAAIVLKNEAVVTADEILDFMRRQLANYKIPKAIDFMEELPKSGAGKILKRVIRNQYVEGINAK